MESIDDFIYVHHKNGVQIMKKDINGKHFIEGKKVELRCHTCGKVNLVQPNKANRNWKYCDKWCKGQSHVGIHYGKQYLPHEYIIVHCNNSQCLKELRYLPGKYIDKKGSHYCSIECSNFVRELRIIEQSSNRVEDRKKLDEAIKRNIWLI